MESPVSGGFPWQRVQVRTKRAVAETKQLPKYRVPLYHTRYLVDNNERGSSRQLIDGALKITAVNNNWNIEVSIEKCFARISQQAADNY